jgi:hypothetical protein
VRGFASAVYAFETDKKSVFKRFQLIYPECICSLPDCALPACR